MTKIKLGIIALVLGAIILPSSSAGATKKSLYYAGWIPYWKKAAGVQDTSLRLDNLNAISPFSYEVKSDGALVDKLKIAGDPFWPGWLKAVHDLRVKIIPTVAWFDGPGIHALLSNSKKRIAHEDAIAKLVKTNKFDGIDIDYESKLAETKNYFSLFIKGLALRLHPLGKQLTCTIEARAPIANLLANGVPKEEIQRANDYAVLNKNCDEIRLMAYDQGTVDPFLNQEKGSSTPYAPVADPAWVEKIVKETINGGISRSKLMLGVPTYGYEYTFTKDNNGNFVYNRARSWTYEQALLLAASLGVVPERNSAGELSFFYPTSTPAVTNGSIMARLFSLAFPQGALSQTTSTPMRMVWFSDAKAISDKISLAKKYKLKGIIFFKLDGEADPALWEKLK